MGNETFSAPAPAELANPPNPPPAGGGTAAPAGTSTANTGRGVVHESPHPWGYDIFH